MKEDKCKLFIKLKTLRKYDCDWLIPGWRGRVMRWRLVSSSRLRLMMTVAHCVGLVQRRQWWSSTVPYWWASTQHAFTSGRMQQTCTRRCSLKTKQWSFQTYKIHSFNASAQTSGTWEGGRYRNRYPDTVQMLFARCKFAVIFEYNLLF